MANFSQVAHKLYIGAAADTKPTGVPIGSRCYEYDTNKWYITDDDGTNWREMQNVDGIVKTVSVTKALAAAGDYAAEDVLSESAIAGTAWTFTAVARANGASGYITKAHVICETTGLTPRLTLFLFKATPTSNLNDNVANTALLHADLANYIGKIDFPAMEDLGGDSEAVATPSTYGNLPLAFTCASGADDLYGILVTRDAITGESAGDDMTVRLTVEQY
jgi:hypothetical protein